MTLIHNWRDVLAYAWSVRFIVLAAFFGAIELALPLFGEWFMGIFPDGTPGWVPLLLFSLLSFVFICAAGVSRFVAQRNISG